MSWKTCCCCFLSTLLVHVVLGTNTSCPAWHYYNNATGQCECGHGLSCRNQVEIRNGYCATSSKQGSDYLTGDCPFTACKVVAVITVYNSSKIYQRKVIFTDPTVEWLSHKYTLYTLIALVPFISVSVIPSVLLFLYRTRVY
jgi:hypothetical protein